MTIHLTTYPERKQLLLLVRDTLDRKPHALKLIRDTVEEFTVPTLRYLLTQIRTSIDEKLAADEKP